MEELMPGKASNCKTCAEILVKMNGKTLRRIRHRPLFIGRLAIVYTAGKYSSLNGWTVIIARNLAGSPLASFLRQKNVKIRTSASVLENCVILPKSKTAFLILELTSARLSELTEKNSSSSSSPQHAHEVTDKIDDLVKVHANCYVILQAALFTGPEMAAVYRLQARYLSQRVNFLLAHNTDECVTAMITISSLEVPPVSDVLHKKFCDVMTQMVITGVPHTVNTPSQEKIGKPGNTHHLTTRKDLSNTNKSPPLNKT